jgi:hypothetical protein
LFLVFILSTIGIRCAITAKSDHGINADYLNHGIDITQVGSVIFTLLTNITATAIIAFKAWYLDSIMTHRVWTNKSLQEATHRAEAIHQARRFQVEFQG